MNLKLNDLSPKLDKTVSLKTLSVTIFAMAFAVSSLLVLAEALRDPTQVPAGFYSAYEASPSESSNTATATNAPALQSVMLSQQLRAAIINGKKVLLGKKYENATLVALSENSATLRNQDGTKQTLYMDYSAVKKTPIAQNPIAQNKHSLKIPAEININATQVTRVEAQTK